MRFASLLFALAAVTACKSKSKTDDKPAAPTGSGSVTAVAPPPAVDAAAAPAPAPAAKPATVPTGPATFGCIGWATTTKTAACITGEDAAGEEPRYQVDYVNGSEPATKLAVKQDAAGTTFDDATAANAVLAKLGIEPFPSPVKEISKPGTTDLGGGASLTLTAKQTKKGGENIAPTTKYDVVVTCANKQKVELAQDEQEGLSLQLYVWSVPDYALIEVNSQLAREGEYRTNRSAMLLELATCKLVEAAR